MTQTILAFGDSNTYGTPPMTQMGVADRFGPTVRWPRLYQQATGCTLIEEGLPGRTAGGQNDPVMGPHMNGQLGLRIALQSHGPIDRLIIMLGTNDLKAHFGLTPQSITSGIAGLLSLACGDEYQTRHGGFKTTLICPPKVKETGILRAQFFGAAQKSAALPDLYRAQAQNWDVDFLDANAFIETSDTDGVHFEPEAHSTLAHAVVSSSE